MEKSFSLEQKNSFNSLKETASTICSSDNESQNIIQDKLGQEQSIGIDLQNFKVKKCKSSDKIKSKGQSHKNSKKPINRQIKEKIKKMKLEYIEKAINLAKQKAKLRLQSQLKQIQQQTQLQRRFKLRAPSKLNIQRKLERIPEADQEESTCTLLESNRALLHCNQILKQRSKSQGKIAEFWSKKKHQEEALILILTLLLFVVQIFCYFQVETNLI